MDYINLREQKNIRWYNKENKKEMSDASYAINRGVGEKAEKEFTNLSHRLFYLENFKQFDSKADFFDFVLLHELNHGKYKRRLNESMASYEKGLINLH